MKKISRLFKEYYLFILAVVIVLAVWEWIVQSGKVPPFILPAPSGILDSLIENREMLMEDTWATLQESLLGFSISIIAGSALGIAMFFFRPIERMTYPAVLISQTIPTIALSPIFVMWFGYSIWSKVGIAVLTAFFPIVVSVYDGLNQHDKEYVDLLRSMGAKRMQIFRKVQLPMALPSIFSGLKLVAVFSVVGATIGEWLGADAGLGYYTRRMSGNLNAEAVFSAIFLLSILGMLFFVVVAIIEKRVLKWKFEREEKKHEVMG
ncbi:ABC transporter integral membrane protein [Fictibacillus macauensis ZFHKF-1]|uniref:ABC transporter integral membrane protein n=1 Tax=Fictibacillus macauensis ZFHKF-1 TaxID=1196324 RepID=I8UFR9_9BACL|nr:ABC transporter permease [Fictibacillus macauensis]EIT85740.1 ABC transporter integral membrane protein [Fictibacillus macauensis ZFHKF-1]